MQPSLTLSTPTRCVPDIRILVCGDGFATLIYGDVSERPKVPASKAGVARATEGSNPSVTASESSRVLLLGGFSFAPFSDAWGLGKVVA